MEKNFPIGEAINYLNELTQIRVMITAIMVPKFCVFYYFSGELLVIVIVDRG
jgi:hypothetical protein